MIQLYCQITLNFLAIHPVIAKIIQSKPITLNASSEKVLEHQDQLGDHCRENHLVNNNYLQQNCNPSKRFDTSLSRLARLPSIEP